MPPQQPSKQTATAPPTKPKNKKRINPPPNPSCCRSRGGMRGWPLPRPTHAPATTLKTNGNSAPIKPMSLCRSQAPLGNASREAPLRIPAPATTFKTNGNSAPPQNQKPLVLPLPRRHAWLAGPPANTCSRNRPQSKRQQPPPHKTKNPSCRHSVAVCVSDHSRACERIPQSPQTPRAAAPAAACVAGRSTGQHMLPQPPSVQTTTTPKPSSFRNLRRKAGMPSHWRECEAPLRRTQRDGADETILSHPLLWSTSLRHRSNLQRKKQKPTLLVPSTPVVARRRMTTPVVNTRPTPEQPPRKKQKPTSLVPSLLRWHGAAFNIPPTPEQPPRKKQHRHSGHHFAQAEGKYPESPPQGGRAKGADFFVILLKNRF